eukprot:m.348832 g.348832  ORF g.348832 m.348832 type:complete len:316 (-) comp39317_c0_seq1:232-1179(-)
MYFGIMSLVILGVGIYSLYYIGGGEDDPDNTNPDNLKDTHLMWTAVAMSFGNVVLQHIIYSDFSRAKPTKQQQQQQQLTLFSRVRINIRTDYIFMCAGFIVSLTFAVIATKTKDIGYYVVSQAFVPLLRYLSGFFRYSLEEELVDTQDTEYLRRCMSAPCMPQPEHDDASQTMGSAPQDSSPARFRSLPQDLIGSANSSELKESDKGIGVLGTTHLSDNLWPQEPPSTEHFGSSSTVITSRRFGSSTSEPLRHLESGSPVTQFPELWCLSQPTSPFSPNTPAFSPNTPSFSPSTPYQSFTLDIAKLRPICEESMV